MSDQPGWEIAEGPRGESCSNEVRLQQDGQQVVVRCKRPPGHSGVHEWTAGGEVGVLVLQWPVGAWAQGAAAIVPRP
jgi:hypothetical protein